MGAMSRLHAELAAQDYCARDGAAEMLAALKPFAAFPIERPSGGFYDDDQVLIGFDGWVLTTRMVKAVRAAIAKAEGRA